MTRNIISSEYYKNKKSLNETKAVLLGHDKIQHRIDPEDAKAVCLEPEIIAGEDNLLKKFLLPKETKTMKKLADYFAYFNNKIFDEQQRFNAYRNKKTIDNLIIFSKEEVELVTQTHVIWAEITSHLGDYQAKVAEGLKKMDDYAT